MPGGRRIVPLAATKPRWLCPTTLLATHVSCQQRDVTATAESSPYASAAGEDLMLDGSSRLGVGLS